VCSKKREGGLNIVNPLDVVIALMSKWVVSACEPGDSNFKKLMQYRLSCFQPYSHGGWNRSLEWFSQHSHKASPGSKIWNRMARAWKTLVMEVEQVGPSSYDEWLSTAFWWSPGLGTIGPDFSRARASELFNSGLQFVWHAWCEGSAQIVSAHVAAERFGLLQTEFAGLDRIGRRLNMEGGRLLLCTSPRPGKEEWIGLFDPPTAAIPTVVFQGQVFPNYVISQDVQTLVFDDTQGCFTVMPQSKVLLPASEVQQVDRRRGRRREYIGTPARVRVQSVAKGPRKKTILFYYGKIRELTWDPAKLKWPEGVEFLHYSTKLGRKLLQQRQPPLQLLRRKWSEALPGDFRFQWSTVWDHERQIWHKAVAVNVWRGKISQRINVSCPMCGASQSETVLHRFWECDSSQQIWYSINCLLKHLAAPAADVVWDMPDWKQTIFAQRPPRKFKKVSRYWTLLKGIALWTIWISRNDTSFNNIRWSQEKIKQIIWQGFCDYGRSVWQKIQSKIQQDPTSIGAALVRFDSLWLRPTICTQEDLKVRWVKNWPTSIG
jgi:hypothetical protein